MNLDVESSWNAIQITTDAMQGAAANEDWEQVMELAARRHQDLMEHFKRFPVGPDNAEYYRERINDMLRNEQELQNLAQDARKQVMRAAIANNQNHRAVGAYLKTAVR